jgi:stage V sporulation protein SpoVS
MGVKALVIERRLVHQDGKRLVVHGEMVPESKRRGT